MRYILYLFTMALIFVGGMLVGNVYLPARNATLAASISVPGAVLENDALQQCTLPRAEQNLNILGQALNSCPVVVNEEKDRLMNQIKVLLARQDFEIKKARYELEIAKNAAGTRTTSEFAKASSDYAAALAYLDNLVNTAFPQPEPETPTDENAVTDENNPANEPAAKESVSNKAPAKKEAAPDTKTTTSKQTAAAKTASAKTSAKAETAQSAATAKKSPAAEKTGESKK